VEEYEDKNEKSPQWPARPGWLKVKGQGSKNIEEEQRGGSETQDHYEQLRKLSRTSSDLRHSNTPAKPPADATGYLGPGTSGESSNGAALMPPLLRSRLPRGAATLENADREGAGPTSPRSSVPAGIARPISRTHVPSLDKRFAEHQQCRYILRSALLSTHLRDAVFGRWSVSYHRHDRNDVTDPSLSVG
jgi:hypothetical protein